MDTTLTRRVRLMAVAAGLLAAMAMAVPSATADEAERHSATASQLAAADAAVLAADIAGTAWYTDAGSGSLVVTADRTVTPDGIAAIKEAADVPAGALDIRRAPGEFREFIAGGDIITTPDGLRCTVAFNVRDTAGITYALTAGHCTEAGADWSIGPRVASSFPGNDYGLIRYDDPSQAEGGVRGPGGTLVDITGAATPSVGQYVIRSGSTTGTHGGTVTALNVTVNYGGGDIVYGLIQTNVCAEPGDSGGPLYSGHTAHGITSGGSGNCSTGGTTFFQPVVEPLNAYGVYVF